VASTVMSMNNSDDTIGNRTLDLPACTINKLLEQKKIKI